MEKKEIIQWTLLVMGITAFVVLVFFILGGNRVEDEDVNQTPENRQSNQEEQTSMFQFFENSGTGDGNVSSDQLSQEDPFADSCAGLEADNFPILSGFTACAP